MRPPVLLRCTLVLGLLVLFARVAPAQPALFNEYVTQPDVWRPATPGASGVDARGDLNLSIPLVTVPGRNGLDFDVRLDYRSGIKIKQDASWIGLGWSFDAGSITRDVQGGLQLPPPNDDQRYNVDYADVHAYQPDTYYVTTPGGSFSMTRAQALVPNPPLLPERSKDVPFAFIPDVWRPWKIEHGPPEVVAVDGYHTGVIQGPPGYVGDRDDFPTFTLTAENGTRYRFAVPTLSTYTGYHRDVQGLQTKEVYVSSWRLVSILGPDYTPDAYLDGEDEGSWIVFHYGTAPQPGVPRIATTTGKAPHTQSVHQTVYLRQIETPTHRAELVLGPRGDGGYAAYPWQDYIYSALREVRLYAKAPGGDVLVKAVRLVHATGDDHHGGAGRLRLKLQGLHFYGADYNPGAPGQQPEFSYAFDYYAQAVPGETFVDDFGYYNDAGNNGGGEGGYADLDATPGDGKAWSLQSITYPPGGRDVFVYENDWLADGSRVPYQKYLYRPGDSVPVQVFTRHYDFQSGTNVRQGGARVQRIERFLRAGDPQPVATTLFAYADGLASGVPEYYQQRLGLGDSFYKPTSRGTSEVYYPSVRRIQADGTFQETRYLQGEQVDATFIHLDGDQTFATGNQHITWGIPEEIRWGQGATVHRIEQRTHDLTSYVMAQAFRDYNTAPTGVDIAWRPAHTLQTLRIEERGGGDLYETYLKSYVYHSVFDGSPRGTGLVRSMTETSGNIVRTTRSTFGYEVGEATAQAFEAANRLNVTVRTDVSGRPRRAIMATGGGSPPVVPEPPVPDYLFASTVTTWKTFADAQTLHPVFQPFRIYQWEASAPVEYGVPPAFGAWDPGQTPSAAWKLHTKYLRYDAQGHVTRQRDARDDAAHETVFVYGDNAAPCTGGGALLHSYLTCVQRGGLSMQMTYTGRRQLASITDPNGNPGSFTYDAFGRLQTVRNADGAVVASHTYDLHADPAFVQTEAPLGAGASLWTRTFFDGLGRPVQTQGRACPGGACTYTVAATRYDEQGRVWKTWKPYRWATGGAYDPDFQDDPQSRYPGFPVGTVPYTETTYAPDGQARVAQTTPPYLPGSGPHPVQRQYAAGAFNGGSSFAYTLATDENGWQTRSYIDAWGRPFHVAAAVGTPEETVTAFVHDVLGNVLVVEAPNHAAPPPGSDADAWVTRYLYDTRGQLRRMSTPEADGNANGDPTDEDNSSDNADTRYRYDAAGTLRFTEDPLHRAAGAFLYTRYDALDRVVETGTYTGTTPFGGADADDPAWPSDHVEQVASYRYDAYSRTPPAGTAAANMRGRLTEIDSEEGYRQYFYDKEGRVVALFVFLDALGAGKLIEYFYDLQGNVRRLRYQHGASDALELTYTHDDFGRLSTVHSQTDEDAAGPVQEATYTYTAAGQVEQLRLGTLAPINYTYHVRDWLTRINDPDVLGDDVFAMALGYAAAVVDGAPAYHDGTVSSVVWTGKDHDGTPGPRVGYTFTYDALNRLIQANFKDHTTGTWADVVDYDVPTVAYDPNGNITSLQRYRAEPTGPVQDVLTYSYQDGSVFSNRLRHVTGVACVGGADPCFAYDANGNMTRSRVAHSVEHDRRNLPVRMRVPASPGSGGDDTLAFAYNADGQRILKRITDPGGVLVSETVYLRDVGGNVLAVYKNTGAGARLQHWNILAGGSLLGRIVPAAGGSD